MPAILAARSLEGDMSSSSSSSSKVVKCDDIQSGKAKKRKAGAISEGHDILSKDLIKDIVEDVYEDSRLQMYHPSTSRTEQKLSLYIMPMIRVPEHVRSSVKHILHLAWQRDKKCTEKISNLLGLTRSMNLRSGKSMERPRCSLEVSVNDLWLIWEVQKVADGKNPIVGALVLRRQTGGLVIEYLTALRVHGGKGFPMVQAAEVMCTKEGYSVLWSAVDLSQDGRYFGVISAEDAHQRWGFQPSTAKEWQDAGLDLYDEKNCSVRYMKKQLKADKKMPKAKKAVGSHASRVKSVQVEKVGSRWVHK
eukprot:gnl/MRDRNA2_/MRDRNA2_137768_c0_seq1.p1 gnl/MRDRNA2_/MRDRNA2_137768_c0~~gnl/MRDRNA2_/MRDRNA2_137768_c0_seq1.p1  ORF type:complete len:306 (-),score=52.27 gnl/MRDRNA2_/MRDRNA2_137768_c0_seq1:2-919(-)